MIILKYIGITALVITFVIKIIIVIRTKSMEKHWVEHLFSKKAEKIHKINKAINKTYIYSLYLTIITAFVYLYFGR